MTTATDKQVSAKESVARNHSIGDAASAPATAGADHDEGLGQAMASAKPQAASEHATHKAKWTARAPSSLSITMPHASSRSEA